jgi:hypothetical protein|eukprot:scaffold2006_cov283-Chaetoceros_neogracile.AAC.28
MVNKNLIDTKPRYTRGDIDLVDVKLGLVKRDAQKSYNVRLAEKAANLLETNLETRLAQGIKTPLPNPTLTLHVQITRCTPGSRAGRICCGELGLGWALLFVKWSISEGGEIIIASHTEKYTSSGFIGLDDICESTVGEDFIFKAVRAIAPGDIVKKAVIALGDVKRR